MAALRSGLFCGRAGLPLSLLCVKCGSEGSRLRVEEQHDVLPLVVAQCNLLELAIDESCG